MTKILSIEADKCTGCSYCEMVCALKHTDTCGHELSRIKIVRDDGASVYAPVVCHNCASPACVEACPTEALTRPSDSDTVLVDANLCVFCEACTDACPWGVRHVFDVPALDAASGDVRLCDLCGGDPTCVKFCSRGALSFIEQGDAPRDWESNVKSCAEKLVEGWRRARGGEAN